MHSVLSSDKHKPTLHLHPRSSKETRSVRSPPTVGVKDVAELGEDLLCALQSCPRKKHRGRWVRVRLRWVSGPTLPSHRVRPAKSVGIGAFTFSLCNRGCTCSFRLLVPPLQSRADDMTRERNTMAGNCRSSASILLSARAALGVESSRVSRAAS